MPGPPPSQTHARARNDKAPTVFVNDGTVFGDELPEEGPGGEDWHPRTVSFWHALRTNPLMSGCTPLDWEYLLDTALMHHTMWARGKWEFAAEVRLRVSKFGATPEDRIRMRVSITTPADDAPAKRPRTASRADRRARLTSV